MSGYGQEPGIVIIGLGYIAEYIVPGYEALLGNHTETRIIGVTADEADIERKRRTLGFPVYLGENERALREGKPDIIIFAPPPSVAMPLTHQVLLPYYEELRKEGSILPDLYAFPPSPSGEDYQSVLGEDVNVVNIVPNMFRTAAGTDISQEGFTLLSFPKGKPWEGPCFERLSRFSEPFGALKIQKPELVLSTLAGVIAAFTASDTVFAIANALYDGDQEQIYRLGRIMRGIHRSLTGKSGDEAPEDAADPAKQKLLGAVVSSMYDGTVRALTEKGLPREEAEADQALCLEQQYHVAALESRRVILYNTRKHATKGGVTERAEIFLTQNIKGVLKEYFSRCETADPQEAYNVLEPLYYKLTLDVASHGSRLAQHGTKRDNALEQHAVMLGLLAKYAIAYGKDAGREAFVAGVTFSTLNSAVSRAPKCAWNDYWRKHGLLEYGKYFCTCIDEAVIKGFNSSLSCQVVSNLSWGAESCEFDWKAPLSPEEEAQIAAKKAELGDSCVRDFNYHIGHVVHSVGGEIIFLLGDDGQDAADAAVFEFTCIFGREYTAAFEGIYPGDPHRI
ncbi:L-2-amino-thiazoline-4-carboxylic acid hydrolase [Lachnospiraceae bacterium 54-53]